MKLIVLTVLIGLALAAPAFPQRSGAARTTATHTFGWQGEHFLLDGKPFQIISGDMHYARVPRQYWRDRMKKMKAMGLNTLTTYVFWNLHEPKPGQFDFTGNLDLAAYIRTAQEEGLWVIVRPGPYVCSEWEFGGLPAWLLATPDMKVRSTDPRFLKAAEIYMRQVGRQLAPLQITRGGPVIMVQVENEYGAFGSDKVYLNAVRQMITDAGFDVTLFTSDRCDQEVFAGRHVAARTPRATADDRDTAFRVTRVGESVLRAGPTRQGRAPPDDGKQWDKTTVSFFIASSSNVRRTVLWRLLRREITRSSIRARNSSVYWIGGSSKVL